MRDVPLYRVRETLLSRKPGAYSLEVAAFSVLTVLGISLLAWRNEGALFPTLAATSDGVLEEQQYWRLVTAVAVHTNIEHFFSNAIFLTFFTYLLFGYFGFWIFPVLGLALSGLTNYLALLTYPPRVSLVGASGLVYWMAGFWLSMYLLVDRSLGLGKRVMRVVVIALVVFLPTTFQENVSYRTHAIGLGLGVGSAYVYFQRHRKSIRAAELVE
ncbi:MAG: rhomboid family intramembrane serine protease, partial [Acidobacteria bacterium]|nr:rhomboid family intramembrane serine protease [Acidobacteriota bacterium]